MFLNVSSPAVDGFVNYEEEDSLNLPQMGFDGSEFLFTKSSDLSQSNLTKIA